MLAQEANEALPSRCFYGRCYEITMLAQEANEALPSRYCYSRCYEITILAQDANEAPDIVIIGANRRNAPGQLVTYTKRETCPSVLPSVRP